MPRRDATGVVRIFLIWGIDVVCIVVFSVYPLTVMCAGLSSSLVLIVVFVLVVHDRSKRKVHTGYTMRSTRARFRRRESSLSKYKEHSKYTFSASLHGPIYSPTVLHWVLTNWSSRNAFG